MDVKTKSFLGIGSIFSLLFGVVGFFYSVFVILFLFKNLLPVWSLKFFNQAEGHLLFLNLLFFVGVLLNTFFLGVVISFHSLCREENKGLVSWISLVAIIGASTALFQQSTVIANLGLITQSFFNFGGDIQSAISFIKLTQGDHYLFYWASLSIWFISLSCLAINNKLIPSYLVGLGILVGVLSFFIVVSILFSMSIFYIFSWGLWSLIIPIWGILEGFFY